MCKYGQCDSIRVALLALIPLIFLAFPCTAKTSVNGDWRLTITGQSLFFFGTRMLTAGLTQDWQVVIDFQLKNNQFDLGTGNARLVGEPVPYSHPKGMFQCQSIEGVYLDRGLHEVTTPHIRYAGFPVAGQVNAGKLTLKPDVEYIGNFIAMMFACTTREDLGDVWHDRGRLSLLERGKRQDAKLSVDEGVYSVNAKEVQFVEPRGEIELPLIDGLSFTQFDQASFVRKTFMLEQLR